MPRKLRNERLTAEIPNHIILRGNNQRRLFSYPDEYRLFLRLFTRAREQHKCVVHALCLMTNHIHNLTTPPSVEAGSRFVARFAQRYAQIRNAKRAASGKLFEQRFDSKPVSDDAYLCRATLYIDANPVRAGIVKDPLDYPWSTYALHAGVRNRSAIPSSLWSPSPWYLSLGATAAKRAQRYRELFEAYVETDPGFPELEHLDQPYTRRLLRPNGRSAAENTFVSRRRLIPRR